MTARQAGRKRSVAAQEPERDAAAQTLEVDGRSIPVTNGDQILYPAAKFTKQAVVAYYVSAAPFLLPHLKKRPVALKRYPNGIHGDSFWEKDAPTFTPAWVKTAPVPRRDSTQPPINYILIDDRATLAWTASIAALEIHPFLHRVPALDRPTMVVFDLDPGEGSDVLTCARVSFLVKELLERLGLRSFAKVSGSKGLQVYVPLNTNVTYDVTQPFAKAVAELLAQEHPKLIVADMAKVLRKGKIFIDWSQNADHKTTVGVYSLRAKRHRPYVSMPVEWEELHAAVDDNDADALLFLPAAAIERLRKVGDLFEPLLGLEQTLPEAFLQGVAPKSARRPKSLATYAEKRRFEKTPEPAPASVPRRSRQGGHRRFVIQKHAASHLHYDLRLESQDVLRSWSVPKGMPYTLDERRLAVATEDHPLDYLTFEGVIPQGQYGGGTVMVWDIGTYDLIEGNYWKGILRFFLSGAKLKGEWLLQRDREKGENAWALTKAGKAIKPPSKAAEDASALSNRTMAEIARDKDAEWQSHRAPARDEAQRKRRAVREIDLGFVEPMQCKLVSHLPDGPEWQYEVKYDGYRALGIKSGDRTQLLSRRGNRLDSRFPGVAAALSQLPSNTMIDGEIVALDEKGRPSFKLLHRASTSREQIFYYVFDILAYAGQDLRDRPLDERRRLLATALGNTTEPVRHSAPLEATPDRLIAAARNFGFEGIVAKRLDSRYEAGERSGSWQKCRVSPGQELVIGGYMPNGSKSFDALLVGYYDARRLLFIAKIKNGFVPATKRELIERMRPLATEVCPFANLPEPKNARRGIALTAEVMKRCRWVKPQLVAQIEFAEWTDKDHLRHARFLAVRDDKEPREVTRESIAS